MGYLIAFVAGGLTVKFWWPLVMKAYNKHLDSRLEEMLSKHRQCANEKPEKSEKAKKES